VSCSKSPHAVYLKFKANQDEEFFVRTGPGTTKLQTSDAVEYVQEHFTGG
jgi:hypothetical protein